MKLMRGITLLVTWAMVATIVLAAPPVADAQVETFVDGTQLELLITSPEDGAATTGGSVDMTGTARIGGGNPSPDTVVVVAMDLSGSTQNPSGGDCGGNYNGDGETNSILDCQIAAVEALERSAIELGTVAEFGVSVFGTVAFGADMQPAAGRQRLTAPGVDLDNDGRRDVSDVVRSVRVGRSTSSVREFTRYNMFNLTNMAAGFRSACNTFATSSQPNRILIFLSDGVAFGGQDVRNESCGANPTIYAIAIGSGSGCDQDPENLGSLNDIVALGADGECFEVTEPDQLPDLLGSVLAPEITGLTVSVNGGPEVDISNASSTPLPARGPVTVDWATTVDGLAGSDNEVCITVYGTNNGETQSSTECITVGGNNPPIAIAGGDQIVSEGALVTLDGSASSDPDDDPLSYAWELTSSTGQPPVVSASTEPTLSFLAFDDAMYEFTLTVSDGRSTASDTVAITVENAAPVLSAAAEPATAGGVSVLTASFTDAGLLDTHSATIDWGDGTIDDVAVSGQGNGWGTLFGSHVYTSTGDYTATVTVTDDDGATATAQSVSITAVAPLAIWADGGDGIDWTGGGGTVTGLTHSNGGIRTRGQTKTFDGPVEYVTSWDVKKTTTTEPPIQVSTADAPVVFDLADYAPGGRAAIDAGIDYFDMSNECGNRWDPSGPLTPGLYYVPCDVKLNSSALDGEVTIVSTDDIQVSGSSANFAPFIDGLLFLSGSSGNKAIQISSSGGTFFGFLNAPAGRIDVSGSGNTYLCGMVADRIDISDGGIEIAAVDCVRPDNTVAPPALVPNLATTVTIDPETVIPGDTLTTTVTATNDGALLFVPGVVGIENLGDEAVTINDVIVGLEYLPVGSTTWLPIPATVTVDAIANDHPSVTYGDPFANTWVGAGGLASWGVQLEAQLDAATVALLLDDTQVAAVRNTFDVDLFNVTGEPVRRLFRYGNDFSDALRALSGGLTDSTVYVSLPDGTTQIIDAIADPALALIAPGETATVEVTSTVAVPAPRGADEPSQAYIDRLLGLNDTPLTGSAYAVSSGGVGSVLGGFTFDQATRIVPVVTQTLDGPPALVAGDTDNFDITWTNTGAAPAATVDATATVDNAAVVVTDAPAGLVAGEIALGSFAVTIDADAPVGLVPVDATTSWTDANGNLYGDVVADAVVEVASAPDLIAQMADAVVDDADGSGVPSIGDTIGYSVTITNRGATPADDVMFDVFLDTNSSLGVNPVTTSQGTVGGAGNNVIVDVGTIAPMASVEITFEAFVNGGTSLSAQGTVTSSDTDPVLTDDPGFLGAFDPTVTTLVVSEPSLVVSMGGRLGVDPDGDGTSENDTFVYELLVTNTGLTSANQVEITIPIDPNTTLVPDSVVVAEGVGQVISGNAAGDTVVTVDLGTVASFEIAEITFEVTVNDGLPDGETEISAQATATFTEDPTPVLSDDPALPGTEDPTVFTVTTTTTPGGGGGGDGEDPPGDTGPGNTWGDDAGFGTVTPTSNQIVPAPIPVTAEITPPEDTEIDTWTVTAFPAGGDPATGLVLSEGEGTPPAFLATFDPTVLSNGVWTIRIEATDDADGMGVHEVNVVVDGQLKLGRFSTTWLDSSVAVSGIPVRVLRTYDTIERYGFEDFGYGWTLDVANFEVATNRPLHEATWQGQGCGGGLIFTDICYVPNTPRIVNVTWPDGRVDSFELRAKGNTFITGLAVIDYVPLPGTNSQLFPADGDDSAGVNAFGQLTESLFFPNDMYAPTQFVLEAIDGTRYVIDVEEGLIQATDLNSNTVTFTDEGIISSQGQSLLFARDEQGRIITVTEPDGSTVDYVYDGAGDLATVVDQNGVSANFTYDNGHYLTNIDDVSAGAFQAIGYDADGRLSTITDRTGNTTSVSVDVDGRTTLVTSPDGAMTTLTTADDRGNIIRSEAVYDGTSSTATIAYNDDDLPVSFTDPVGGSWSFTYDGDQNVTSITDANGATETLGYDSQGRVTSKTDRLGGTTILIYDSAGNLTSMIDGVGRTETFAYDAAGSQISRTDGAGRTWSRSVDGAGRTTSVTDPNGNTTGMSLDSNGRIVSRSWPDGGTESFSYDAEGNLTSHSDPLGRTTTFGYDTADRVISRTNPAGGTTQWSYDANGRVLSESNPNGETWSYTWSFDRLSSSLAPDGGLTSYSYDGANQLLSVTDPIGRSTSYSYDPAGRRTSMTTPVGTTSMGYDANGFLNLRTNANGETTTYGLNPIGQMTSMTDPLGRSMSYAYDVVGQRTAMTDRLGNNWSWSYDGAGQLTSETVADGGTYSYSYDGAGNMTTSIDPLGRVSSYSYDPMNRRIAMTQPGGGTATWTFDTAGQLTSAVSPAGYSTSISYDPRGLPTQASDDLGNTTFSSYDAVGRLTSRTDANGGTYGFTYDPMGRLTSETDPLGGSIQFSYDAAGQRTSFTNPNGASRSWSYDNGGRVTSHSDELGRIMSYSYDPVGRQLSMTDPRGITTNRTFDAAGQLVTETAGGETRSFSYDSGGRLTSFSDITGATSMSWDPMGRLTSASSTAGTVGYGYNLAGEQVSMTQPEGAVSYSFNGNSDLVGMTDWRGDTASFTVDADGRMLTGNLANNTAMTYGYDGAGRLNTITHNGPGGVIDSFNYTLDNNGNRTAVTSTEGTENYTLDSLNRITAASYSDGTNETFAYDAAGNRTSHTKVDGTTVTYSHDAAGQLGSDSTGTDYTYDGAGNLIATSTGDAYTYNPWGNLTEATVDGVTTTAAFDATGTRVSVDGVTQLWDRTGYGTLISTSAGDNYLHNPTGAILRDGDDWLHTDAVGSVRYSTDPTGTVTSTSAFTVFGEPRTTSNSDFGFAGEQTDPTGLVHLRARAYNPTLGSFMAYDPLQPGGPSTAGWNHYSYSANNPTTWTDPTGQAVSVEYGALAKRAAIGAAIGGVISLWTCQNDFSWKGPFGGNDLNGGCVAGSIILGAIFGPIVPATFAGLCLAGAADGAAGHTINAWLTDADASIKGAVRDGGIGCAIALLTAGIGNLLKRARNAIGNNGPTTNPDGPGTRTDGEDGSGGNRDAEDGAGCTGTQCVPCNSFPTGTQVRMGNGTHKPIESIEPGDYVLAHDLDTGQWRPQLVLDQWSHLDNGHMATATIQDGSQITATDHHLFWNETGQTWTELDQIQPGEKLLSPNGPIAVTALNVAPVTETLVWELTVATDHNFTVSTGETDLLVHNQLPCMTGEDVRNRLQQLEKGGTRVRLVDSEEELIDLFDELTAGATNVPSGSYDGIIDELPDGTQIRFRPDSRSGGATIDINFPGGTPKPIKVHIK